MWMMGCRDSSGLNTSDSINGRKLRPLIPRPTSSFSSASTPTTTTTTSSPSCLGRIHGSDFLSLHNPLGTTEHGKRELGAQPVSSRWNPTPEQLRTLEDLYRRGTRTPNAEQIQYITAQLRRYGKIEGKNVFYWFQNHKARERQKRKRRIEMAAAMQTNLENTDQDQRSKDFDTSRKAFESEGYKGWPSPTNCSTLAEESPLVSRPECKREGWLECNAQAYVPAETQAAWQMMQLCSLPRLISSAPTAQLPTPASNTSAAADPKLAFGGEDFDVVAEPSRTLELFPLRSDGIAAAAADKASTASSYQFIQFLPLKN